MSTATTSIALLEARADELASGTSSDFKRAAALLSEIVRTPHVDPATATRCRLKRAEMFLAEAKRLKSYSASTGEQRPDFGIDSETFAEMAMADADFVLNDEGQQNSSGNNNNADDEMAVKPYVIKARAAQIMAPHREREFIVVGLCEYPESKTLREMFQRYRKQQQDEQQQPRNVAPAEEPKAANEKDGIVQPNSNNASWTAPQFEPSDLHLECGICTGLFSEPVTLSCGHSWCRSCIAAMLDHSTVAASYGGTTQRCPLCRAPIHVDSANLPRNSVLDHIVRTLFPHRRRQIEDAAATATSAAQQSSSTERQYTQLPLFVCNSASPGHLVQLQVFEPRYRTMMRRALKGSRKFVLVEHQAPTSSTSGGRTYNAVGTVVTISDAVTQPDGRILIAGTAGERVFIHSDSEVDGYRVGACEVIHDDLPSSEEEASRVATDCRALVAATLQRVFAQRHANPPACVNALLSAPSAAAATSTSEGNINNSSNNETSTSNAVDGKWALENWQRVVEPASLWVAEFFADTNTSVSLSSTARRVEMCAPTSARGWLAEQAMSMLSMLRRASSGSS